MLTWGWVWGTIWEDSKALTLSLRSPTARPIFSSAARLRRHRSRRTRPQHQPSTDHRPRSLPSASTNKRGTISRSTAGILAPKKRFKRGYQLSLVASPREIRMHSFTTGASRGGERDKTRTKRLKPKSWSSLSLRRVVVGFVCGELEAVVPSRCAFNFFWSRPCPSSCHYSTGLRHVAFHGTREMGNVKNVSIFLPLPNKQGMHVRALCVSSLSSPWCAHPESATPMRVSCACLPS